MRRLRDAAVMTVCRVEATDSSLRIWESEHAGIAKVMALSRWLAIVSARGLRRASRRHTDITPYWTPVAVVVRPNQSIDEERQIAQS